MRARFLAGNLPGYQRLLLFLTVAWCIAATPGNYFGPRRAGQFWALVVMIVWTSIAAVVVYSILWRKQRPATYGFSFARGSLASLAVIAAIHVYLVISGRFVLTAPDGFLASAFGAFMEEVAFRVIAIDSFIVLMNGIRAKGFWAILASTLLWTAPHIVTKSPSQLVGGIFLGGLVFGYIYYKTRSILLPAWIHGVANAGYLGGLLIVVVYCLISAVDTAMSYWPNSTAGLLPRVKPWTRW